VAAALARGGGCGGGRRWGPEKESAQPPPPHLPRSARATRGLLPLPPGRFCYFFVYRFRGSKAHSSSPISLTQKSKGSAAINNRGAPSHTESHGRTTDSSRREANDDWSFAGERAERRGGDGRGGAAAAELRLWATELTTNLPRWSLGSPTSSRLRAALRLSATLGGRRGSQRTSGTERTPMRPPRAAASSAWSRSGWQARSQALFGS
jgi:hypothetical protein